MLLFVDEESGYNFKVLDKCLIRENSGESSGFEEMFFDKDVISLNFCLFVLNVKEFFIIECIFVS